jgi:hypothetical protein
MGLFHDRLINRYTVDRLAEEIRRSAQAIAESAVFVDTPPAGAYEVSTNPMECDAMRQESAHRTSVPADVNLRLAE